MRSPLQTGFVLCSLTLLLSACTGGTASVVRASTLNVEITTPPNNGAADIAGYTIGLAFDTGQGVTAGGIGLAMDGNPIPTNCTVDDGTAACQPSDAYGPGSHTLTATVTAPNGATGQADSTFQLLLLPPDPGEAGKATLLGIDSDNDGVRDDIQRYIELNYTNSAKTRMALRQFSKAMNDALANAGDKRASINNAYKTGYAPECLFHIYRELEGTARPAYKINDQLLAEFLNTQDRSTTYLNYNSQLGGEVFSSTPLKFQSRSCETDPSTLPD